VRRATGKPLRADAVCEDPQGAVFSIIALPSAELTAASVLRPPAAASLSVSGARVGPFEGTSLSAWCPWEESTDEHT
jgi:hypothetical protein